MTSVVGAGEKVVLVVVGGFPSLSQTFVLREIASMRDMGWRVHVLAPQRGGALDWEQASQFGVHSSDVTYLNWRDSWPSPRGVFAGWKSLLRASEGNGYGRLLGLRRLGFFATAERLCKSIGVRLIHAHFVQWAAEVGVGLSMVLKVPLTVTAHDSHLPSYPPEVLRGVQRAARTVACVSQGWKELWASRTGSGEKLVWIPNGVALDEFTVDEKGANSPPRILSVSNCVEHKRPHDLIAAVAMLRQRGVDAEVEVIGGGPFFGKLQHIVRTCGMEDRVVLQGSQPHTVVRESMGRADIFALCSERESFGIVTAEAMAAGLPTVVSNTVGARDLVVEGKTGYLYPVGNVTALADRLEAVLVDATLRRSLGLAGRARIESEFSWEMHMKRMNGIWEEGVACQGRLPR